jgi:solute carrier family 27 fatty acid transporter 1/4
LNKFTSIQKGENCSTAEVESVISSACGLKDAIVFGVQVPGAEGRAGMAVISDPDGSLDLEYVATGIAKSLPSYARPLFIRVSTTIDMTGLLKQQYNSYCITFAFSTIYNVRVFAVIFMMRDLMSQGTYKLKKLDYQKLGYDITKTDDKIYFLKGDKYVIVNTSLYTDIINGKARV